MKAKLAFRIHRSTAVPSAFSCPGPGQYRRHVDGFIHAAVASAKVTATQTATGLSREAISNTDGYFVFVHSVPRTTF